MSNQNVSTTPPEAESDERVIPQETLDEVIEEFGGRLSNDVIRKVFD